MANTNAQLAYEYLTAAGLSPGAATGVVGNLVAESGVNPDAVGDSGKARGIAQWHAPRWQAFYSWGRPRNLNPGTLSAQLQWLVEEMKRPAGGNVWEALKTVTDPYAAAALFMRKFERPADQSDTAAQRRAQAGITAVKGASAGTSMSGTILKSDTQGLIGGVTGAVVDPVVQGFENAAGSLLQGIQPIIVKGMFAALGVGLIGVGLVKMASPTISRTAGAVL